MSNLFAFGGNTYRLDLTTSADSLAIPGMDDPRGKTVRVYVDGDGPAFVAFGGSGVVAAIAASDGSATGIPLAGNRESGFTVRSGATHISGIMASGTASLYVTVGDGI